MHCGSGRGIKENTQVQMQRRRKQYVQAALQVQLAGDAWYFGKKHEKDTIGDPIRDIEPRDILRSEKLMIGTEVLTFLLFSGIRLFF